MKSNSEIIIKKSLCSFLTLDSKLLDVISIMFINSAFKACFYPPYNLQLQGSPSMVQQPEAYNLLATTAVGDGI